MLRHRVNLTLTAGLLAAGFMCFCGVQALFLALLDWEEAEGQGEHCDPCAVHLCAFAACSFMFGAGAECRMRVSICYLARLCLEKAADRPCISVGKLTASLVPASDSMPLCSVLHKTQ